MSQRSSYYSEACRLAGAPPPGYRLALTGETVPYGCPYRFAAAWYGNPIEWRPGSKTTPFTVLHWHRCAIAVPVDGAPYRVLHEDD